MIVRRVPPFPRRDVTSHRSFCELTDRMIGVIVSTGISICENLVRRQVRRDIILKNSRFRFEMWLANWLD